jgi:hypothetical protein
VKSFILDKSVEETADSGVDDDIVGPGLVETLDEVCQVLFYLRECWKVSPGVSPESEACVGDSNLVKTPFSRNIDLQGEPKAIHE